MTWSGRQSIIYLSQKDLIEQARWVSSLPAHGVHSSQFALRTWPSLLV